MIQWCIRADGPERGLWTRNKVQDYFSSMPLTEVNMSLRRNFLMFLHGCHLHDLPMFPHAAAVIGPRSVIKCMSMPYFDRAVMEFIHYTRGWIIWTFEPEYSKNLFNKLCISCIHFTRNLLIPTFWRDSNHFLLLVTALLRIWPFIFLY